MGKKRYEVFFDWNGAMGQPLDLRLYGRNLGDTEYATGGNTVWSTGFYTYNLGAPRTWGLEVRYRFGSER